MIAVELIFLLQVFVFGPHSDFFASILPGVLTDMTNESRGSNNERPLEPSPILAEAAKFKAEDMAENGYFAHVSPDGKEPWYWLSMAGYDYDYAGENLAVNFADSKDVVDAWMKSPSHRENILNINFTEIGIATATGTYEGREALFVVQFFGRPTQKAAVVSIAKPINPEVEDLNPVIAEKAAADPEVLSATSVKENLPQELNEPINDPAASKMAVAFSSPRNMTQAFYAILMMFFTIALIIYIAERRKHPHLAVNGAFVLVIAGMIIAMNKYLIFSALTIK